MKIPISMRLAPHGKTAVPSRGSLPFSGSLSLSPSLRTYRIGSKQKQGGEFLLILITISTAQQVLFTVI